MKGRGNRGREEDEGYDKEGGRGGGESQKRPQLLPILIV